MNENLESTVSREIINMVDHFALSNCTDKIKIKIKRLNGNLIIQLYTFKDNKRKQINTGIKLEDKELLFKQLLEDLIEYYINHDEIDMSSIVASHNFSGQREKMILIENNAEALMIMSTDENGFQYTDYEKEFNDKVKMLEEKGKKR